MSLFLHVPSRAEAWRSALGRALPEHTVVDSIAQARYALVWRPPPDTFRAAKELQAVFALGAGVESLLLDPSLPASLPLIRLHDAAMATQMVDYHLHAALHFQRDFDAYQRDQNEAAWRPRPVRGRLRVGVLGLGALGAAVAKALVALDFPVRGWSRRPKALAGVQVYAGPEGLELCLRNSELLLCLLPHTPNTAGLLDAQRLAWLPRGAAIVNTGRGSLIDLPSLVASLDSGHVRGAFLDVLATEPLPAEDPLWTHPGVRVTPHIAAQTAIEPAVAQIAEAIATLEAGERPQGRVDRLAGY